MFLPVKLSLPDVEIYFPLMETHNFDYKTNFPSNANIIPTWWKHIFLSVKVIFPSCENIFPISGNIFLPVYAFFQAVET